MHLQNTNIFWPVHISNQELWTRAKEKPIELEIRQRIWGWLGHTFCQLPGDTAKAALEWNPQGTRSQGRPRTTWRRTILEEIIQGKTWNEITRQKSCQMAKLCEGPVFPSGMTGNYYIIIIKAVADKMSTKIEISNKNLSV